jgi:hypothetical protein
LFDIWEYSYKCIASPDRAAIETEAMKSLYEKNVKRILMESSHLDGTYAFYFQKTKKIFS